MEHYFLSIKTYCNNNYDGNMWQVAKTLKSSTFTHAKNYFLRYNQIVP